MTPVPALQHGSIVRTSYGSGPYRLLNVVRFDTCLTLVLEGAVPHLRGMRFWINGVAWDGTRWMAHRAWGVDEVFIEADPAVTRQLSLWEALR